MGTIVITANLQARKRRHRAATQTVAELSFVTRTGGSPEFSVSSPQASPPLFDWEAPLFGAPEEVGPHRRLGKGRRMLLFLRIR